MVQHSPREANAVHGSQTALLPEGEQGNLLFRDTAQEHIARIREMVAILESHGVSVRMLKTDRVGYVVYEDEHQVVASHFLTLSSDYQSYLAKHPHYANETDSRPIWGEGPRCGECSRLYCF